MVPTISIIIVNYNSGDLLHNCVSSIQKHIVSVDYEVLIVDNASTDNSTSFIRQQNANDTFVRLIQSECNAGFAIANNVGAALAHGQYFHFLNPDTLVTPSLDRAYASLIGRTPERSIYTTHIADHSGGIIKTRYLLPTIQNYLTAVLMPGRAKYWHIGASVIINRDLFNEIGGWPEDYFMYAEDLDLFYQIARRNICVKSLDAVVIHASKGSTEKVWSEFERLVRVEKSYQKFCCKYDKMIDYYVIRTSNIVRMLFVNPQDAKTMMSVMKETLRRV